MEVIELVQGNSDRAAEALAEYRRLENSRLGACAVGHTVEIIEPHTEQDQRSKSPEFIGASA